ncbi:hypothetical protein Zmor_020189 [Zophobas morio]|uniref:Uncharacterized protein n=1 Tax=Zophobas morio TaxID=2755281 RepID=A0AA38M985_9CUCU|nr:hypothetical protein Zmor_020189 [Zophobas morio]
MPSGHHPPSDYSDSVTSRKTLERRLRALERRCERKRKHRRNWPDISPSTRRSRARTRTSRSRSRSSRNSHSAARSRVTHREHARRLRYLVHRRSRSRSAHATAASTNFVTLELVCRISRSRPRDFRRYCLVQICRMSHLGEAKHSLDSVLICRMSKQKSIQYRYPFLRTSLLFCFSALGLGLGKKSYSTSRAEQ